MKSIKNILVTTDFSKDSDRGIEEAAMLAKKFCSNLYMLGVVEMLVHAAGDSYIPSNIIFREKNRLIKDAHKKMFKKVMEMERKYKIKAVAEVRYGDIYEEILKEKKEKNIDLLVIAPHEKHKISGWLFSRLSDRVVKGSQCDTLLVKRTVNLKNNYSLLFNRGYWMNGDAKFIMRVKVISVIVTWIAVTGFVIMNL